MLEFLNALFSALGVDIPAALAASATVIAAVAWLAQRGVSIPAFSVWKLAVSSGTATTLAAALVIGGYAQYAAVGFALPALLGGWVLTYLAATGIYDGARALLKK